MDYQHTFAKWFRSQLSQIHPEVTFYPEPNFQQLQYPAVVFHWGNNRKTATTSMWMHELQIDILYNEFRRAECSQTTWDILEFLNLAADIPGNPRRTGKVRYLDEHARKLDIPEEYIPLQSDIQWRMPVDSSVDTINEIDNPEYQHMTFTIYLYYKNR